MHPDHRRLSNVSGSAMDLIDTAGFGLTPLRVDKGMAAALLDALRQARKAAKGHKETLRFPGRGDRGAPLRFHGWNTYSNVACAKHDPAQQAKHTCVLYRGERDMLQRLSAALPGFGDVLALASSDSPGMEIALVHALFQDSPQACFNWHCDNGVEGSEDVLRTIVILLSDTASSMQMKGFSEYAYDGQGSAALFDSGAVHRSGNATAGTVKIALFLRRRGSTRPEDADVELDEPSSGSKDGLSGLKRPRPDSSEAPCLVSAGHTTPELAIDGPGATLGSEDGVDHGPKAVWKEICAAEQRAAKLARRTGFIVAPSRCAEGFRLPSGNQRTCLPDAAFSGLCALSGEDFKAASLARLRSLSMPTLGNELEASWATLADAFLTLKLPFELKESTSRFMGDGGPMLNLLCAEVGVFVVGLVVTVDGKKNFHAVMLSKIKEKHAPFGRLVDNTKAKPVYIEKKDLRGREAAKMAFRALIQQNPNARDAKTLAVNVRDVYEIVACA